MKTEKKAKEPKQKRNVRIDKKGNKHIKKAPKSYRVPKTVQDTIPYEAVYEQDGIIETEQGVFTRSYLLQDINYQTAKIEDQKEMYQRLGDLLNTFDPSVNFEITINNKHIPSNFFEKTIMIAKYGDNLDEYRDEFNEMLEDKLSQGSNDIQREKYLTISIKANDIKEARNQLSRLDTIIKENVKKIGGSQATPLSSLDRLKILHGIFNSDSGNAFGNKAAWWEADGNFSFKDMRKAGLTTKDMIAPESFEFKAKDYFMIGDTYARGIYLTSFPAFMKDEILTDITSLPIKMLTSVQYEIMPQIKAMKLLRNQMVNINSNIIEKQKRASKAGFSPDIVGYELKQAQADAENLMTDISRNNQNMILITVVALHMAENIEQLEEDSRRLQDIAARHMCQFKKLNYQQELAMRTALPLARNELAIKRTMTTESACVFMPFSSQELIQKGGMYYGLNPASGNMIYYNKQSSKSGNGFILGRPGSGKSFSAKREMVNVLLARETDDVIVIDPESEYGKMAAALNGEVIKIAPGSKHHINPMDMDMEYGADSNSKNSDPVIAKAEFILSICQTVLGGYDLSPTLQSVIDRCVRLIYKDYIENPDKAKVPTLADFQKLLAAQREPEARTLATALEIYTEGSLNVFAFETNVNSNNRFIVYDINEIGNSMKPLAMLIVLDSIWNRIIVNSRKGRRTWIYIDEIYLLFSSEYSATFLRNLFKRARKWGAVPTGITQNVEDILKSEIARTMIFNSEFVQILNQSEIDKQNLAALLNISDTQQGYITNSNPGEGLICIDGKGIFPFKDEFPKNTKLYKVMTSTFNEINTGKED